MHQLIPLAAMLAFIIPLLSGCTTPERRYRATALSLPYHEFDQAYGDGWRSVFEHGEGLAAVALIEDYLRKQALLSLAH